MTSTHTDPATKSLSVLMNSPVQLDTLIDRIAQTAHTTDTEGAFPEDAFNWLAESGLLAITLPDHELDFTKGKTAQLLYLLKRIGSGNLAVGRIYEGHINALYLIHLYASPQQRIRWYADVTDHHRLFSVWNTQANDGVRINENGNSATSTTYRLSGAKTFCSGAGWIHRPLITGELTATDQNGTQGRGWQMAIVPTERVSTINQDERFWKPLGMRASASFKLDFSGIELTDDDLLGHPGDYLSQPYFSGGAIRFAAVQLGGAESIYEATRQFLAGMNRTDDILQQTRLAEMAYLIESGNQWIQTAGNNVDKWLSEETDWTKIVAFTNMVRTAIEEICLRVMPLAERCIGARGLLRPHPFERIHRDLTLYLRQPAPDATLVDIGKFVLNNDQPSHKIWQ